MKTSEDWMDWNKLSLEQMVEHLRESFKFSSSGDAKCIYHLIEFYDKHKAQSCTANTVLLQGLLKRILKDECEVSYGIWRGMAVSKIHIKAVFEELAVYEKDLTND